MVTPGDAPGPGQSTDSLPPGLATRREQMFFPLKPEEIARLERFGAERSWTDGEFLFEAGQAGRGMIVVLEGAVRISRRDGFGHDEHVVDQGAGHFLAEVDSLSGRAAQVDGRALGPVRGLVIPPEGLRSLVVAEAELGERIMRALILRRVGLIEAGGGVAIVGPREHPDVVRLTNFLSRNGLPHHVLDAAERTVAAQFTTACQACDQDLPLVICPDGQTLRNPSERELAECIGYLRRLDGEKLYDVAVVGAGPAGLAAAVYAASEGLTVAVLDRRAFGGQAGASARIENYLGFPTGISGQALAGRAYVQAQKFGADIAVPTVAAQLVCDHERAANSYAIEVDGGETIRARTVVVASGADYRRPDVPGVLEAERDGLHYWASPIEGGLVAGQEVVLVGGGNSAGQAAVFLATRAERVWMLVRRPLADTMSRYLIDRIEAQGNIEVVAGCDIERFGLDERGALTDVAWRERGSGELHVCPTRHAFLFIGADPCTRWLDGCDIDLDDKGFVRTGADVDRPREDRPRLPLETSRARIFAIGDVRSGSTKRVAAAVGEGAAVVAQIHAALAALEPQT